MQRDYPILEVEMDIDKSSKNHKAWALLKKKKTNNKLFVYTLFAPNINTFSTRTRRTNKSKFKFYQ